MSLSTSVLSNREKSHLDPSQSQAFQRILYDMFFGKTGRWLCTLSQKKEPDQKPHRSVSAKFFSDMYPTNTVWTNQ